MQNDDNHHTHNMPSSTYTDMGNDDLSNYGQDTTSSSDVYSYTKVMHEHTRRQLQMAEDSASAHRASLANQYTPYKPASLSSRSSGGSQPEL